MKSEFIAEAESVEEALEIALKELGVSIEDVDYTVIEESGKKRFGFGASKSAKVSVVLKSSQHEAAASGADGETAIASTDASEVTSSADDSASDHSGAYLDESVVEEESSPAKRAPFPREEVDYSNLTDEEIDKIADTAIGVVTKLAELAGAADFEIEEFEGEEGEIILDLVGGDLSFLIGRHGRTLDALQTATSAIVTKQCGIRYPLSIDIEGYRHRRKQKVREIAQRAAERALRHGRPVELRPMSPQERRLVHVAIRDISGVTSTSEGSGDARHVVVMALKG